MVYPNSDYPGALDTITAKAPKQDKNKADDINFLQRMCYAIEAELGTDPAGSVTDVKTRLARCLNDAGGMRSGTSFPVSPTPADGDFFYRSDQDIVYVYDGTTWDAQSGLTNYAAGDYALYGPSFTFDIPNNTSYNKVFEMYIPRPGTLRTVMRLGDGGAGARTFYARIYRNGSAVGTERSVTSTTVTSFTEDISGWSIGDLLQVYVKVDSSLAGETAKVTTTLYENVPSRESVIDTYRKPQIWGGAGVPESGLGAQGDIFLRTNGSTSTTLYVKTGASTWTAK